MQLLSMTPLKPPFGPANPRTPRDVSRVESSYLDGRCGGVIGRNGISMSSSGEASRERAGVQTCTVCSS